MPTEKRNAVQNKSSKSKSSRSKKKRPARRKSRPKVRIPLNQVVTLCLIILVACTALILINSVSLSSDDSDMYEPSPVQYLSAEGKSAASAQKNPVSKKQSQQVQSEKTFDNVKSGTVVHKSNQIQQSVPSKPVENTVSKFISEKPSSQKELQKSKPAVPVQKADVPYIPDAIGNAKLVFVFDDGGQNLDHLDRFLCLPFPITVAVLPKLLYSKESARKIRASGNELILHQPMQALNLNVNPGKGAITPDMTLDEVASTLRENIEEIGPLSGLNNHEGSMITEDEVRIGKVLSVANELNLYFLDSRTTSQTRVPQAAMGMGFSYYERNIFLDNVKTRANVLNEIAKGIEIANKKGSVIMIGHVWSADFLPQILEELYPLLKQKGYVFTTVSKSGALIVP